MATNSRAVKSEHSNRFVRDLAKKHGVSEGAVEELRSALRRGGGTMAQFSHPDLGGNGQWMAGGMIMVGDMFNDALKAKVAALCQALRTELTDEANAEEHVGEKSVRARASAWWPEEYGASPSATGGQNDFRYAYFPRDNVLVVERDGKTDVYDTTGHDLQGFGQQQVSASGFTLRTSRGPVDLTKLPRKKRKAGS